MDNNPDRITLTSVQDNTNVSLDSNTYTFGSGSNYNFGGGGNLIFTTPFITDNATSIGVNHSTISSRGRIELVGEDSDILFDGESLRDTLRSIQDRLNLLRPNPELEQQWDQLRELGDAYRRLEAELLEKQKMWQILQQNSSVKNNK